MPWVFVRNPLVPVAPTASEINSTLAPICGVPAASRTTPASLPGTGFACAAAGFATKDETMAVRTRAPRARSRSCFTLLYLPGEAFAAVLVSGGAFTVNSAEREMV